MKEIKLTQGYVALIDDEDFEKVSQYTWFVEKRRQRRYARNKIVGYLHRFIMNTPKELEVDHKDWNGLNCQKVNLVNTTRSRNAQNQSRALNKLVGVYLDKRDNRIFSSICVNYKNICLGTFSTQLEAAKAYNIAALQYFGSNARLNEVS